MLDLVTSFRQGVTSKYIILNVIDVDWDGEQENPLGCRNILCSDLSGGDYTEAKFH